jgi:hypothetical protein
MASEAIQITNKLIVTTGDMSGNISSGPVDISTLSNYSVQFTWSGTSPIGDISVQISNDGINFDNLSSPVSISSNSGTKVIKDSESGYKYIQAVYTFTSGVGSLNVILNGKTP